MPSKRKPGRPRLRRPKTDSPSWYDRLLISPGDVLRRSSILTTGNLSQRDVEHHDVVNAQGHVIGTVVYSESTSLKPPFKTSHHLVHSDVNGAVIVEETW